MSIRLLAPALRLSILAAGIAACEDPKVDGGGDGLNGTTVVDEDGDGDGFFADEDCNDSDVTVNPGAAELCDGVDNDCDGVVDEDVTDAFYADLDGDGFGDPTAVVEACSPPADHVDNPDDCDDASEDVFPGAAELCNDIDDNCDGAVDEGLEGTWYADGDGDGHGDPLVEEVGCDPGDGWVERPTDCDDTDATVSPDGVEVCNERDDDCDEVVDEGVTTTFFADLDGDGWGRLDLTTEACAEPAGYATVVGDCDDATASVSPDATELCNGIDDNCDGAVDEDSAADAATFYADTDGDGFGDSGAVRQACAQPSGFVVDATDCDDTAADTFPGAPETCDGADDDCDGTIDEADATDAATWYADSDGDGYGDAGSATRACSAPSGFVAADTDCDDGVAAVNPGATETCNDVDDDCDGLIDDDDTAVTGTSTFYTDSDGDGYGDAASTVSACELPAGAVADNTDCDDSLASVNPGAAEVCSGMDDDCDGFVDDGDTSVTGTIVWSIDYDGDGYGASAFTTDACNQPTGFVDDDTDCDDTDGTIYPSAPELCDGEDNDCDADVDEGVIGASASCAATSCAEVLDLGASTGDGDYYLDPDGTGASLWTCDMTTDGGGWTLVADWNRIDDGDTKADFESEFTVLFNNMSTYSTTSNALFWQDVNSSGRASADALSVERDVPVTNDGEILYDVYYNGRSMEQSGAWFWAESSGTETVLECFDGIDTGAYSATEMAQMPTTACSTTSPSTFTWSGPTQDTASGPIDRLRFSSLHYDSCCDYSYLYRFEAWVR